MQVFNSADARHEFSVDGRKGWIPEASIDDFETLARLDAMSKEEQIPAFRDFILSKVQPRGFWAWATGRDAVSAARKLGHKQLGELFNAWISPGGQMGESSGSADK